jgi:hypothetical protein
MKHKRQAKVEASAAAPAALQERDSFQVALQHAAWMQRREEAFDMPAAGVPAPPAHSSKGAGGGGLSDVQLRRDNVDLLWTRAGMAGPGQLTQTQQEQHLSGSDAAGAAAHQADEEEAPVVPVKRARGRQRKNTGVETAQQVSVGGRCEARRSAPAFTPIIVTGGWLTAPARVQRQLLGLQGRSKLCPCHAC